MSVSVPTTTVPGRAWLNWRTLLIAVAAAGLAAMIFGVRARAADSEPSDYVSMTPCRVLDTRPAFQVGPKDTPVGAEQTIIVDGHGASGDCVLPDTATGLMLNITAVGASDPTFLTVWPTGEEQPNGVVVEPGSGSAARAERGRDRYLR